MRYRNHYFVLRHGESEANKLGIIASHPDNGLDKFGLTAHGEHTVTESVQKSGLKHDTVIYTSDFLRCRQTAEIASRETGAQSPGLRTELRERDFGDWEKTSTLNYQKVWSLDPKKPGHTDKSTESVLQVSKRLDNLLAYTENKYQNRDILFVSHGDILQILQTIFNNSNPGEHRQLPELKLGELRKLS